MLRATLLSLSFDGSSLGLGAGALHLRRGHVETTIVIAIFERSEESHLSPFSPSAAIFLRNLLQISLAWEGEAQGLPCSSSQYYIWLHQGAYLGFQMDRLTIRLNSLQWTPADDNLFLSEFILFLVFAHLQILFE